MTAYEADPPRVRTGGWWKAKAPERNRHPHDVAEAGEAAAGVPDRVETEIVPLSLGDDAVQLDAERRDEKLVGALAVVEGVEKDADKVVVEDLLPPRHPGADTRRIDRMADEHRIQVGVVIRDVHFGPLGGGRQVLRLTLEERVGGNPLPAISGQEILEPRRRRHVLDREALTRGRRLGLRHRECRRQKRADEHLKDLAELPAFV